MVEVSAPTSKLDNAAESNQLNRELLFFDEMTGQVAVLQFTLEDVFDRTRWGEHKLPAVFLPQKKRA